MKLHKTLIWAGIVLIAHIALITPALNAADPPQTTPPIPEKARIGTPVNQIVEDYFAALMSGDIETVRSMADPARRPGITPEQFAKRRSEAGLTAARVVKLVRASGGFNVLVRFEGSRRGDPYSISRTVYVTQSGRIKYDSVGVLGLHSALSIPMMLRLLESPQSTHREYAQRSLELMSVQMSGYDSEAPEASRAAAAAMIRDWWGSARRSFDVGAPEMALAEEDIYLLIEIERGLAAFKGAPGKMSKVVASVFWLSQR